MHWDTFKGIITAQWEGMGDVGSARYKPTLLPPCPTIKVSSYSISELHKELFFIRITPHSSEYSHDAKYFLRSNPYETAL